MYNKKALMRRISLLGMISTFDEGKGYPGYLSNSFPKVVWAELSFLNVVSLSLMPLL